MAVTSRVDHLVVVADNLDQGAAWCEATFGVAPGPGGRHGLMATHNRLLKIAGPQWPQAYLEVIAIDPAAAQAPADGHARWFGMDDPALQAAVRQRPRLVHWVAQTACIEAACAALAALGEDPGHPVAAARMTPRGELRWRITLRDDGVPQHGGALPALIEWQGSHPVEAMADQGVGLVDIAVAAADPRRLSAAWSAIGLDGLTLAPSPAPARLQARFVTPRGVVVVEGGSVVDGPESRRG